jgi:hypothetical protein
LKKLEIVSEKTKAVGSERWKEAMQQEELGDGREKVALVVAAALAFGGVVQVYGFFLY